MAAAAVSTRAPIVSPAGPAIMPRMPGMRPRIGGHRCTRRATRDKLRICRRPKRPRSERPLIQPPGLLNGLLLHLRSAHYTRIVVDHPPKHGIAIGRVLRRIQNVLVPKLVQIVASLGVQPRNQHESRPHLQQRQKPHILDFGGFRPVCRPTMLFHHRLAHGRQVDFGWVRFGRSRLLCGSCQDNYQDSDDDPTDHWQPSSKTLAISPSG